MSVRIQFRRDTAANWSSANPVLAQGELGLVTDTGQYKIGNGSTAWNALAFTTLTGTLDSIALNAVADPTAPSSGLLQYAKSVAGRVVPKFVGPSGLDSIFQPAIFGNGMQMAGPGSSAALSYFGMSAFTAVGTVSHPTISAASFKEAIRRAIVTSAATANSASELRFTIPSCLRGNSSSIGGFFAVFRFGFNSSVATQRPAVGLWAATGATATTAEPSSITNGVWVGRDSSDTNLQIMHNDGSGSATKVDLGADFSPTNTAGVFELILFCVKGGSQVNYRVVNLANGDTAEGEITTDLPVSTQTLVPHFYINNGGTASAVVMDFYRYYLESDY